MGAIKAELRRFRDRKLRPIFRRWRRRNAPHGRTSPGHESMEHLLVALLRAEIRRSKGKSVERTNLAASLLQVLPRRRQGSSSDLESMVRSMLASKSP